jgi:hypothetical protein
VREDPTIIEDKSGDYARNCLRLKRIAGIAARRKYMGADLIEEVMYDNELRFVNGREANPMQARRANRLYFYNFHCMFDLSNCCNVHISLPSPRGRKVRRIPPPLNI